MGYTQKLPNGKFRARWRDPDGVLKSKTFEKGRDAERHLRAQEVAIDRGVYADDSLGKVTFGEWAEHCFALAEKTLARKTYSRDAGLLKLYVLPRWERMQLARINKPAVERWIADLAEEGRGRQGASLAPATIEKIYGVFRKLMQAAFEEERIPRLPLPKHPPIGRKKRKLVRFLTEAEVAHLALTIDPRYEALILVAAYGGFRVGELAALRLDDVDWTLCTIRVDEAVTDVDGHLEFEDPKTDRAFRTVPIADPVLDKLREHIERSIGWDDRRALLFTGPGGAQLRVGNWRKRHFYTAVARAGLPRLTPHDLRHTAASFFIAEGANPWMLAEILGHSDTRMIDRVYGHLFDKDRQSLRDRMSRRARDAGNDNVRRLTKRAEEGTTESGQATASASP